MTVQPGNWGRWGDDDDRGTLNLLTPEVVRAALGSAGQGRIASLALPLRRDGMPTVPPRPPIMHLMSVDGADYEAGAARGAGGFQFTDDYIGMAGHAGTHVDALSHVGRNGLMYNGHSTKSVRSATGARKLGIERFSGLVARGLIIDVVSLIGGALDVDFEIESAHIEAVLDAGGLAIRPGDAILVHTGWLSRFVHGDPAWHQTEPGIGLEAARWLAAHDVSLIGADNFAIEVVPSPTGDMMPVHLVAMQEHGIHLLELVNLDALLDVGARECLLVVAPLPIVGGVGCPVNPIAVY